MPDIIPATSLVTPEEVVAEMGKIDQWDGEDASHVQDTLTRIQNELETYCNRPLQPIFVREVVQGDHEGILNTSVTPVLKVVSLRSVGFNYVGSAGGTGAVVKTPLSEVEEGMRVVDSWSENTAATFAVPGGVAGGYYGGWYVIEYIGGYRGYFDEKIKKGILRVAVRELTVNYDDTINFREDDAKEAAPKDKRQRGWTEEELKSFDRLRRRVIV